jgi:hypothetical protein
LKRVIKLARNLTSQEVEACRNISYRGDGLMMLRMSEARKLRCNKSIVFMWWEGRKLVSWGILAYIRLSRQTGMYLQATIPEAHFYTRWDYRGRGLAGRIFHYFCGKTISMIRFNDAKFWKAA